MANRAARKSASATHVAAAARTASTGTSAIPPSALGWPAAAWAAAAATASALENPPNQPTADAGGGSRWKLLWPRRRMTSFVAAFGRSCCRHRCLALMLWRNLTAAFGGLLCPLTGRRRPWQPPRGQHRRWGAVVATWPPLGGPQCPGSTSLFLIYHNMPCIPYYWQVWVPKSVLWFILTISTA